METVCFLNAPPSVRAAPVALAEGCGEAPALPSFPETSTPEHPATALARPQEQQTADCSLKAALLSRFTGQPRATVCLQKANADEVTATLVRPDAITGAPPPWRAQFAIRASAQPLPLVTEQALREWANQAAPALSKDAGPPAYGFEAASLRVQAPVTAIADDTARLASAAAALSSRAGCGEPGSADADVNVATATLPHDAAQRPLLHKRKRTEPQRRIGAASGAASGVASPSSEGIAGGFGCGLAPATTEPLDEDVVAAGDAWAHEWDASGDGEESDGAGDEDFVVAHKAAPKRAAKQHPPGRSFVGGVYLRRCFNPQCRLSRRFPPACQGVDEEFAGFGHATQRCPLKKGGCGALKPAQAGGWPRAEWRAAWREGHGFALVQQTEEAADAVSAELRPPPSARWRSGSLGGAQRQGEASAGAEEDERGAVEAGAQALMALPAASAPRAVGAAITASSAQEGQHLAAFLALMHPPLKEPAVAAAAALGHGVTLELLSAVAATLHDRSCSDFVRDGVLTKLGALFGLHSQADVLALRIAIGALFQPRQECEQRGL